MGFYYQRNTTNHPAELGSTVVLSRTDLTEGTATAGTVSISIPSLVTRYFSFFTAPNIPNLATWSGTFNVQINVSAIGGSVTIDSASGSQTRLDRLTSGGGTLNITSPSFIWSSTSGTGLKTASVSWTTTNATSDRLRCVIGGNNSNMMSNEDLTLGVNTTDSYLEVPWAVGGGEAATITPAYVGGGYYG